MPEHTRPGDVLADRYRLTDLLSESQGGRFWRAFDGVLHRDVAVHIISLSDERAPLLREAARRSATILDRRMLRVLDIDEADDRLFVVNEWGSGTSLDILLTHRDPLSPTVAAWIVAEVGDTLALAHDAGVAHGRLVPENVLIDHDGAVRLIGFAVDAALHGHPASRVAADEVDLVGLLYAGLTGKWAGISRSLMPPAPSEHGRVLRPRQVRAGIPRPLDALCDQVLNHREVADVPAARVADSLREFLGTSAGAAEAWLGRIEHQQPGQAPVVLPPLPDPPAEPAPETPEAPPASQVPGAGGPESDVAGQPRAEEGLPTQAGLPIFHDETDDVTWLQHRSEPAPPPPPFEPPPARPLFAPDPADGAPARRPRVVPPPAERGASGFWPWESEPHTGAGSSTGSGVFAPVPGEDDEPRRPGSSWLRLAGIIAACLLLLIGCVIAFNLGRGRTALGTNPSDPATSRSPEPSSSGPSTGVLTGVSATDFDPQGSPPEENPASAPNVVDGNPATTWQTLRYNENFGPGGLKTGVGLVLDLGATHGVSEVDLTTVGSPTRVQVYVASRRPTDLQGLQVAGQTTVTGTRGAVRLEPAARGRYVVIWLTSLPAVPGGFRGEIAEAVVKGD
ncbi:protein kinase family protein [Nocardioides cynanchi]|uniref:protein kinase family protein n=1 Tax=Nocardioides cynanchi TaxID=2558918 RepID=UPI0012449041|nr:protein kinase family protein [Nocardioides cynanchi]